MIITEFQSIVVSEFTNASRPTTAVDSDAANNMMDLIREKYVNGDLDAVADDDSGIKLVDAEEFS